MWAQVFFFEQTQSQSRRKTSYSLSQEVSCHLQAG